MANLVFDTEFIYKAQVEPVRAGPVCGGFFLSPGPLGKDGCAKSDEFSEKFRRGGGTVLWREDNFVFGQI